ncbi:hypothetical protein FGO68_gene13509 [Halteria grandinella]|uniref:Uncharacterized protein n=1 Tax=Halteria grandinella TaxID=5974 RepID=A0A8J8NGS3_HALGN|nr:hypothetical protein FGO68_gene13509 [Halteria grandinella]
MTLQLNSRALGLGSHTLCGSDCFEGNWLFTNRIANTAHITIHKTPMVVEATAAEWVTSPHVKYTFSSPGSNSDSFLHLSVSAYNIRLGTNSTVAIRINNCPMSLNRNSKILTITSFPLPYFYCDVFLSKFSLFITIIVKIAMKRKTVKLKIEIAWIISSFVYLEIWSCRISRRKMLLQETQEVVVPFPSSQVVTCNSWCPSPSISSQKIRWTSYAKRY